MASIVVVQVGISSLPSEGFMLPELALLLKLWYYLECRNSLGG